MQLTPNYNLSQFTKSGTATKHGIDNTPDDKAIANLRAVCVHILEPLAAHFSTAISISSGYRAPAVNKAVGGSIKSQHCTGEAVDIHIPTLWTGRKWFEYIRDNMEFDQIIWEHDSKTTWIHVSYREGNNRKMVFNDMTKK